MTQRAAAAFGAVLAGLLASMLLPTNVSLLGWLAAGVIAGAVANDLRLVPVAWLAVGAFYATVIVFNLAELHFFWQIGAVGGALLVSFGFVVAVVARRWRHRRRGAGPPERNV